MQPLSDANYVLEYEPLTATDDPRTLDAGQCRRTATYADGLGRPVQTVRIGASPSGADLVTRTDYDSAGRESRSWLPVPVPNNGGKYVAPATLAARAESFYADEAPYGRTLYEASPLHRTASAFGPGKAWHESGRAVRNRYLTNSAADSLRCARYVADSDRDAVRLSRQGDYPEGELLVTAATDEDGRLSYTFHDKGGQSVLIRRMNGSETLDTYYVYDACGLLRAVLPPKASAMLESQTGALDMSSATVADLTYLYRYDRRGRTVGVRRPGAQEVRYLYDDTDRPVFSQDGVQRRSGEWSYSIPDALGREVLRGTCKTLGGANLAQSLLDGKTLVARYDGSSAMPGTPFCSTDRRSNWPADASCRPSITTPTTSFPARSSPNSDSRTTRTTANGTPAETRASIREAFARACRPSRPSGCPRHTITTCTDDSFSPTAATTSEERTGILRGMTSRGGRSRPGSRILLQPAARKGD